jgi:hypothetical protein
MATRKKKEVLVDTVEPTVVVGSHLTVTTYPNGKTELKWDDEALARDVREAIESYELSKMKLAVKAKVATRKKKEIKWRN